MDIVIREPVWGDIVFDELEAAIIDTSEMQRLRWIRQLGTADVPYSGATHTRFVHSLGTCHVAGRIFDAAMKNTDPDIAMTKEDRALVRLLGLLHDISHIAFGHVLEDELRMFGGDTHDTPARLRIFLDPVARDSRVHSAMPDWCPPDLFETITHMLASEPEDLPRPFLLEMVKDTVCADLLDYLQRDYLYLGIRRQYDDRIYHYFSVMRHRDNKPHLVVQLTEEGRRAEDSLTEMENLLRIRYTQAERVFFHKTKLGFDAMLDKAVFHSDICANREVMDWLGDEGLLLHLEQLGAKYPIASELGKLLRSRHHYRPAYMVSHTNRGHQVKWQPYMEPSGRREVEKRIADRATKEGTPVRYEEVVVFCPEWEMNMKEAQVLVRDENGDVLPLKTRADSQAKLINERHMCLWRFYAYSPEHLTTAVAKACEDVFGYRNEYKP